MGAALVQEVTLKFQHVWPATGDTSQQAILLRCNKIATDFSNKIKRQLFASMSAGGSAPQLVNRFKDGVDDVVMTLAGYTAGRFPSMEVFELPFMTCQAEGSSKAVWVYAEK
jgi:TRAP-type C4-dicarboxylate transport system substrate-binding protein